MHCSFSSAFRTHYTAKLVASHVDSRSKILDIRPYQMNPIRCLYQRFVIIFHLYMMILQHFEIFHKLGEMSFVDL